ncbi:hypothetical protein AGMMS49992_33420 [Clostridia bacterium]|nr:hypothetical protein AGMMS49992_33420 [Clostridia bacterium]
MRNVLRNAWHWRKTLEQLSLYNGYSGLIDVMTTHLKQYIAFEEQHGYATAECKAEKTCHRS